MATHASALKRQRQNEKQRARNRTRRADLKTSIKKVKAAKTKAEALPLLAAAVSRLHKASRKSGLHHRNASRKVSRLTQFVNKLS